MLDGGFDLGLACDQRYYSHAVIEQRGHLVHRNDVEGVSHRERKNFLVLVEVNRQHAVATRNVLGHHLQRVRVRNDIGKVDTVLTQRLAEGIAQHAFADQTETDQDPSERLVVPALLLQRDLELVFRDQSRFYEPLAEGQAGIGRFEFSNGDRGHWLGSGPVMANASRSRRAVTCSASSDDVLPIDARASS